MSGHKIVRVHPDPLRVRRDYAPQFEASERFLDTLWELLPHTAADPADVLVMNVLGRGLSTYRAILWVMQGGFVDQGWILNRPLFEDMVFGYWISLDENQPRAVELINEHVARTNARVDFIHERLSEGRLTDPVEAADARMNWGGRAGLMDKLDTRVKEIDDLWVECGGSSHELRAHLEITNWVSNLKTHTSGRSLHDHLERGVVRVGSSALYGYGQSQDIDEVFMLHCFRAATFRIGWLARLLIIRTGRSTEELVVAYKQVINACDTLGPSERAKVGRNDPCWCGSGEKLKRCHGS